MHLAAPANDEMEWETRTDGMFVRRRDLGVDDDNDGATHSSRGGPTIKISVSHGSSQHELCLPAESTFGDVKKLLARKTGLEPDEQGLFFRGIKKQDEEHLHLQGVKDKSIMLLLEHAASKERKLEEIRKHDEMLKSLDAVAGIRADVDELSERMAALEVAVNSGTEVSEKEFVTSTELLMRQLLKLDSIEAEGEAKQQRKDEVRRVQNYVNALDSLKERNSKPFSNKGNAVSVASKHEDPNAVTQPEEQMDKHAAAKGVLLQVGDGVVGNNIPQVVAQAEETTDVHRAGGKPPQAVEVTFREDTAGEPSWVEIIGKHPIGVLQGLHPSTLEVPTQEVDINPAYSSILEASSGETTYISVGEILRLVSPSSPDPTSWCQVDPLAAGAASATNIARSVAMLCGLDSWSTELMEIAFNKYPDLMTIRSDRRKSFIQSMFCSLADLLQLLSATSASTLDTPKRGEIEILLRELEAYGLDATFISGMRLLVTEAREARFVKDKAATDLKTLCTKADDLRIEIDSMERKLAAAKAEAAQVEDEIHTLLDFVEGDSTPIFK